MKPQLRRFGKGFRAAIDLRKAQSAEIDALRRSYPPG